MMIIFTMPQEPWRLIPAIHAAGPTQMAIDAWLLGQVNQGRHRPTLRFYTWEPAAISLGMSQRQDIPDHWRSLVWRGQPVDLVKRPSGGRGVLHQGELTYAVVRPQMGRSLDQDYRSICQFLMEGWARLGIELSLGQPNQPYFKSHNCFALATNADLVDSQGRKFIGSAQRRKSRAILQHGSMRLTTDPELYKQVFGEALSPLPLAENPLRFDTASMIQTLTSSAQDCFGITLQAEPLTAEEWQGIRLLEDRFRATPAVA